MTEFDDWTPEQIQDASIQELTAGRLPIRAQQRLATMRADQAFTSDLTVDEHHAIRSVGFSPVGQVMGSCVYHVGYTGMLNCGYNGWIFNGPNVTPAPVVAAEGLREALYEARMLAIDRMRQECAGLGGDGVVAVILTIAPFPAGGLEFRAIGTAVRADGPVRPREPFMSDLSGQDFAKLMVAGWVPCGFLLGMGVMIRHDDYRTEMQQRSWNNIEVTGRTNLVSAARKAARKQLRADCARHGGEGVVIQSATLRAWGQACRTGGDHQHDHLAEAILIGTAITRLRTGAVPPKPLQIMRLR
jgi:uncharacterized protein YbjQ (UPF0145 family)